MMAVSKHGRERICNINPEKLKEINNWLNKYEKFWTQKLDALEKYLDENE